MGESYAVGLCDRFRQYVTRVGQVSRSLLTGLVVPTESEEALEEFVIPYETGVDQAVRSLAFPCSCRH